MFSHIFINRLKCLLREKEMIFWTLLFPILLATLFNMAFANLSNNEIFQKINIAVVNSEKYQKDVAFKSVLSSLSNVDGAESENDLFKVTIATKEESDNLLKNNKIDGYIDLENDFTLVVKSSGLNQTIIKGFLDDYIQTNSAILTIINKNPNALAQGLGKDISSRQTYLKEVSASKRTPNTTVVYFYTLLAMTCFYGGFMGMHEVITIQADLSAQAARVNVAPVHKMKIFLSSLSAATSVQLMAILIVLGYVNLVLKIDFGNQFGFILLTCVTGCFTGVSFGALVSALVKKGEGIKTAILIGVTMSLSFLAGMMQAEVKYLVTTAFPFMAYINPLNLITDCFYSLYYFDTYTRFFTNIIILYGFTSVFCLITFLILRRQKYASI